MFATVKRIGRGLAATLVAAGLASAVQAQSPEPAARLAPLDEAELESLRGGYLSAGGVLFDFGATVRSYVDGSLALESRLIWTETGARTERIEHMPGSVVADLHGLDEHGGLLLPGNGGATALIHNLDGGRIQNLIVNNANGRDLRQEIEIDLVLPQLDAIQGAAAFSRLNAAIAQDLKNAALRPLGGH